MSITIDGTSLVFDGTVTVTNFTNSTTGVCTLVLTPSGGVGNLPALATGDPGPPALFDSVSVTTLASGQQATGSLSVIDPGGPGASSHYALTLGIPQGPKGDDGDSGTLAGASDLSGAAAVGTVPMVTSTSPTAFSYKTPFGDVYNASTISSANSSGQSTVQLCQITVAPQPNPYYPICMGNTVTSGTANTVINIQATLNSVNGEQVGIVYGAAGTAKQSLTMASGFGGLVTGGFGKIAANTQATFYFSAVQTAGTSDAWSTSSSSSNFSVLAFAVAS